MLYFKNLALDTANYCKQLCVHFLVKPESRSNKLIKALPNFLFNWKQLSRTVTWDIVYEKILSTELSVDELDWYELSRNKNITVEIISQFNQYPWNYHSLSENPNLTFDFVLQSNSIKLFDFNKLSRNICINIQHVKDYPQFPWNFSVLLENPNITLDTVRNSPELNWDYRKISSMTMSMDFLEWIIDNKKDVVLLDLSCNKCITAEFIEKHIELKWDFFHLSQHPNVTAELVLKTLDRKWNIQLLIGG